MAEYLAKYLDFHLKKSASSIGISDENLIKIIEEVLVLFKIVRAKDIFEEFYQRGLCRRLLLKKSASYDSEKMMILKLKTECGDAFTTKVENMLKDLSVSEAFMKKYLMAFGGDLQKKYGAVDLNVHVLSSNSWPIAQDVTCSIPQDIGDMQSDFERYYKEVNKGKCIKFSIQMCTALLQAKFSPKNVKLLDISGA